MLNSDAFCSASLIDNKILLMLLKFTVSSVLHTIKKSQPQTRSGLDMYFSEFGYSLKMLLEITIFWISEVPS